MNPDASQQVFVLLLGLTSVGLVGGSVVESGILTPSAEPLGVPAPTEPAPAAEVDAEEPEAAEEALQPDDLVPLGEPIEGVGEVVVAAVEPVADEEAGAVANGDREWAPLRSSDDAPCLVRVNRATMANNIDRREPRETEGPFMANGEPIFCFLDFANGTGVSQPVTLVWTQNETGASYLDEMEAGAGSRWRTWTERPLPLDQLGHWTVQILDSERCLIGDIEFDLVAPTW